jgi:hypothetical protein
LVVAAYGAWQTRDEAHELSSEALHDLVSPSLGKDMALLS